MSLQQYPNNQHFDDWFQQLTIDEKINYFYDRRRTITDDLGD